MTINPIIPIPVMAIICIILVVLTRKGVWNFVRKGIIVLLLFAINLRIMVPSDHMTIVKNNIDVLFVVDNTISMLAEDYNGDGRRMDAVRDDIDKILDGFPGARYSLISFASSPSYMVPYTYDPDLIRNAADTLEGQSKAYGNGTSLNIAYEAMKATLKHNEERDEDDDEDEDGESDEIRIQLVFFISDGEITSGDRLRDFSRVEEYVDTGAVLGYGTRSGGRMQVRSYAGDDNTEYLYYYDSNYNRVYAESMIDEGNLQQIAEDIGVNYYHMTKPNDIKEVISELQDSIESGDFIKEDSDDEDDKKKGMSETYWIFAGALALFLIFEFVRVRIRMGKER